MHTHKHKDNKAAMITTLCTIKCLVVKISMTWELHGYIIVYLIVQQDYSLQTFSKSSLQDFQNPTSDMPSWEAIPDSGKA